MGRKKDPEKQALIEKLGVSTKKNWTKQELLDMEKKLAEKEAKEAEQNALTAIIAGDIPMAKPAELEIPYDLRDQDDPFSGLTERQKRIARLRMRGLSQQAIANLEGVAQPIISKELKRIKEWQIERGANIEQNAIVGNTATLYEEVEQMAWQLYYGAKETNEKAKALAVIMQAREKHVKLLMDLGLLKKASQEVKHTIQVSPFLDKWKDSKAKKDFADSLVAGQLSALPEPSPEADVIDAEYSEVEDSKEVHEDNTVELVEPSDLAEPTPDDSIEIDEE